MQFGVIQYRSGSKLKINWGGNNLENSSTVQTTANILNSNIRAYTNKKAFLQKFNTKNENLDFPQWWGTRDTALNAWFEQRDSIRLNGKLVVRKILNGHSGNGIEIFTDERMNTETLPDAPLYTLYIPKKHEYRVHFSKYTPDLIIAQKKRRSDAEPTDDMWTIRNAARGWVYCRDNLIVPQGVREVAERFKANALNRLDFGAIDIIYNEAQNRAVILEVNTAPGLEGQTIEDYADFMEAAHRSLMDDVPRTRSNAV